MKTRRFFFGLLAVPAAIITFSTSANAASGTWTGATSSAWQLNGNWTGASFPVTGNIATFNNAGNGTNTIDIGTGLVVGGIIFDSSAAAYTIGSGVVDSQTLNLNDSGSIIMNSTVANNELFNAKVTLGTAITGTYTFANNSLTNSLTFAGGIQGGTVGTAAAKTLTVNGVGNTFFKGVIANGGASSLALSKIGSGILTLSGANTFTGATTVNGGTLKLDFTAAGAPTTNIINSVANTSALTLGGGILNVVGNSVSSTQRFASTTLNAGPARISVTGQATVTLGAITPSFGASIRFDGPATVGSGNAAVAATGTITTTTAGAGSGVTPFGILGTDNVAGSVGHYATVGLYDWASTSTTAGGAGTSPYTIIGGSQVTGFYNTTFGSGANFDMAVNRTLTTGQQSSSTIRFNTPTATTLTFTGGASTPTLLTTGGFLVTPNMGANNVNFTSTINNALGSWQVVRTTTANAAQQGVIWQNNTAAYLNFGNVAITDGRAATNPTSIVKDGEGTVVWTASNPYTGQTYVNAGNLMISSNASMGAVGTGGAINLNGGTVVGNATFNMDNAGANKRAVNLLGNGGGLAATAGNTMTVSGIIAGAAGTGPLTIGIAASSANGNTAGLLPGSGAGTANTTAVNATGVVALTNANTFTGGVIVKSGSVQINGINALGGANYGGLTLDGGGLKYAPAFSGNGSGDVTGTGSTLNISALGGSVDVNGNSVTFANAIKSSGTGTLTISDSAVTKGLLTLSAGNTYTGNTILSAGNLAVTNSSGSATGTGNVSVTGGTLSGNGIISGAVTLDGGAISPGSAGTNLTLGSLIFNSGSMVFSLGSSDASSRVTSTNLTFNAAPSFTFNLAGVTSGEVFTLFRSSNTISGASYFTGLSPFTIGRLTLSPSQSVNDLILTASGNPGNLVWNNTGATGDGITWDVTTNQNWSNSGTPDQYYDGDNVTFNDSNNGNYAVTLNSSVAPGSLVFSNSSGDYAVTGSGSISGLTSLVKNGSGKVTLSTANTYSGGTVINSGTIALGAVNALASSGSLTVQGTGTFDLAGNAQTVGSLSDGGVATGTVTNSSGSAALTINNAASNTFSGQITGAVGITKTNTGALTLSGTNTYTGLTTVDGGVLNVASNSALGDSTSATGGLIMSATAIANFTSSAPAIASLASSGGTPSIVLGNGAGAGSATTLTVGGGNASTTFGGTISDVNATTAVGNLAVTGTGTLTLSAANTFRGTTTIASGATLRLGTTLALQGSTFDTSSGGSLSFGTLTAATLGGLAGNQNLTLANASSAAVALTVGANGQATTYSGGLVGTGGSLVKTSTGTLTLTGSNSYTGTTTVSGGTIVLGTNGVINGAAVLVNTGSVQVNGGSLTAAGAVSNIAQGQSFTLVSGSATFNSGIKTASSGGDGSLIRIDGGTFTATTVSLARTANPGAPNLTTFIPPTAIPQNSGFVVTGGTVSLGSLFLGDNSGSSNSSTTAYISGGATTVTNQIILGQEQNNRWNYLQVAGGTLTAADNTASGGIVIGKSGSSIQSELYLTGGTTTLGRIAFGATTDGTGGTAALVVNGGNLYVGAGGILKASTVGLATNTILTSGLMGASEDWSSTEAMQLNGTSFTIKAADASNVKHDIALSGVISGAGALTKTGAGKLTLSGTNTYSGTTAVNAGALVVNGSLSTTSDVTVQNAGSTLGGNGTVSGAVTVSSGAILAAGDSVTNSGVGVLSIGNGSTSHSLGSGSIFSWDLNGNVDDSGASRGVSGGYDGLNITGTLTVDSAAIFRVVLGTGVTADTFWQTNHTWNNIFGGTGSISGAFDNSLLQVVDSVGAVYDQTVLSSNTGYAFSVSGSTLSWSAVPEPTSALAGLLLGAGLLRRKRSAAR